MIKGGKGIKELMVLGAFFSSLASYLEHWYSWCRVGKLDLFGVLENPDFGFQVTAVSSGLLSWSASFTYPAS